MDGQAYRIELDVHLTRDGHLVIVHDENLERTTGVRALVADMTRSEIERSVKLTNGEPLPFLDEFLPNSFLKSNSTWNQSPGHATVEALQL